MISVLNRLLLLVAISLSAFAFWPAAAVAEEAGGGAGCSTCMSAPGLDHYFADDCCEQGDFCMKKPHTSTSGGWCGEWHTTCIS